MISAVEVKYVKVEILQYRQGKLWIIWRALPVVESVVDPVVEPVVEPVMEPVVESVVDPVVEPIVEPIVEPVVVPVVVPRSEIIVDEIEVFSAEMTMR